MQSTWKALLILSLLWIIGTGVALAGPLSRPTKQEARDHLDRGNALYNTRSFDEAITEFKAGALVEAAPVFDYNLGQAYRQLGKYQDALWHYDRFLTYGHPTGELLDAVNAFMAEMRAQLANRALTMPPNGPAAPTDATSHAGANETASPTTAPGPTRNPAPDDRAGLNWLGWGMTVAGVAAMATGGGLYLSGSNLNDQANSNHDERARNDLHDKARTRGILGAAVGIGGVALTAAGIIDLLVTHSHGRAATTASLNLGISDRGVLVLGRF